MKKGLEILSHEEMARDLVHVHTLVYGRGLIAYRAHDLKLHIWGWFYPRGLIGLMTLRPKFFWGARLGSWEGTGFAQVREKSWAGHWLLTLCGPRVPPNKGLSLGLGFEGLGFRAVSGFGV